MIPPSRSPAAWLVGAVIVTVSVSGYFMGLRQTSSQISLTRPVSRVVVPPRTVDGTTGAVPMAVRYSDQDWSRDGGNAGWSSPLSGLVQPPPDPVPAPGVDEAARMAAIRRRAERRAYDGAPPVIPHPVAQESAVACLACHADGLAVKDRVASRISHARHAACTQCHVPVDGPPSTMAGLREALTENRFTGWTHPARGTRAWEGAPPTVPHPLSMREDCLSCHGGRGLFGLRTSHPERVACIQCHVPNAAIEPSSPPAPAGLPGVAIRLGEGRP